MVTFLRAAMLGAVDGVITSFAVVASASALEDARDAALTVGAASVVADGLSMGVSEFLSSASERAGGAAGASPALLGVACFVSFVAAGTLPLVVFLASEGVLAAACFALVELMLLGSARARTTGEPVLLGLGQTAGLGGLAGAVAFGIGRLAS